jgi:hypothetical protein
MVTFKQFLAEAETGEATPGNVDGAFKVGAVAFDNENGLGATPNSANVMYKGAVAWIKPSVFRKLALKADRSDTAKDLEQLLRDGKAIAAPWLDIDIIGEPENPEEVKVTGHEGRARADAFKAINGDVPMPVQLQLVGIRARHLSPEFFKWLEKYGLTAERASAKVKPGATKYFWDGKTV